MKRIEIISRLLIASIWLANGLLCKVFNLVPRHQEIVGRILGIDYAREITILIGFSEIIMAIWILSRFKSRLNAITQMVIISTMNCIEFLLAPDLLLWGKWNALWAIVLVAIIYFNEFILGKEIKNKSYE